ncbi:MAG: hypothetical protein ACW9XA_07730 [Candidatus Nitrosopumilus sp. bin_6a]
MQNRIVFSILLGIIVVGTSQIVFAEEIEKTTHIAVDEEKFEQPKSKYNNQEIVFLGFIEDYARGDQVTINIISPDGTQNAINTYASKKGDIYIILHITQDSQIGVHQVNLEYRGVEIASTTFEILENN